MHQQRPVVASVAAAVALCSLGFPGGTRAFVPATITRAADNINRPPSAASKSRLLPSTTALPAEASAAAAAAAEAAVVTTAAGENAPTDSDDESKPSAVVPQDAPTFLYRKTFWQPSHERTPNAAGTTTPSTPGRAVQRSRSESTNVTAPAFSYRQAFWQPFATPTTKTKTTTKSIASPAASAATPGAASTPTSTPVSASETAAAVTTTSERAAAKVPEPETKKTSTTKPKTTTKPIASPATTTATTAASPPTSTVASSPKPAAATPTTTKREAELPEPEKMETPVAAAAAAVAAATDVIVPPTATAVQEPASSSSSSASEDTAGSVAAATTTSSATATSESAATPAAKVTEGPEPEPGAVNESVHSSSSSSLPPEPVPFEPSPTLISDSSAYQEFAVTIKRAKEFLAPFGKKVQDNVAEGNVGERGEEFVVAQFLLLLFVAMGSVPLIGGLAMFLVGPGFLAGGIGLCAAGVKGLAKSLSPWPAPVKDNVLETEGVYGLVRHPMYTGLVMVCVGSGVLTDSPTRMLLSFVLALVLDKKAEKEEAMLVGLHGTAYEEYCKAVAKFVPRLY
ncbi:unnamed protein product [Pylaiella littoralis]